MIIFEITKIMRKGTLADALNLIYYVESIY